MFLSNNLNQVLYKSELNINRIVKSFCLLIISSSLISYVIAYYYPGTLNLFHIIIEGICLLITLSCFLLIWNIYDKLPPYLSLAGLFFFTVAALNLLYIITNPTESLTINGYPYLNIWFEIEGRIIGALLLLSIIYRKININIKLFKAFGAVLFITVLIILLTLFADYSQALAYITGPDLFQNTIMDNGIIIFIYFLSTVKIYQSAHEKTLYSRYYIFLGLSFAICAEICIVYRYVSSFSVLLSHVFKLIFFQCIYKGIFSALVIYPYTHIPSKALPEQGLSHLEFQTQAILDSLHSLILILDKEQLIINVNLSFISITELDFADVAGKNTDDLISLLQFKNTSPAFDNDLQVFEGTIITWRSHRLKYILYNISYLRNADNKLTGYVICASDITNFKEEQQRLLQQEKLASIGQMAAGIVHEIKNPITTIKGFSQIISSSSLEKEQLKEYLLLIDESSNEIIRVVMDFLAFSKPRPIQLHTTLLSKVINSMLPLIEAHLFINNINLSCRVSSREQLVNVDEEQLKQVIFNMIKNGTEALNNKKNGQIIISTDLVKDNKFMLISIADNGYGIDKKLQGRLGQPFYTTKEDGTGLGLSICFKIIEEHHGYIEVESSLEQGTIFNIYLPVIN